MMCFLGKPFHGISLWANEHCMQLKYLHLTTTCLMPSQIFPTGLETKIMTCPVLCSLMLVTDTFGLMFLTKAVHETSAWPYMLNELLNTDHVKGTSAAIRKV